MLPTRGPHVQGAPEPSEQVARGVPRCQELCNAAPRQCPDLTCAPAKSAGGVWDTKGTPPGLEARAGSQLSFRDATLAVWQVQGWRDHQPAAAVGHEHAASSVSA